MEKTSLGSFFYPELPEEDDDIDWDDYDFYDVSLTNPDDTQLYTVANLFGCWEVGGSYRMTGDGFRLEDDLLYDDSLYGDGYTLTLLQDFTVSRCDPDNWLDVTGEEITIPEGTEVQAVAADPEETTAYFRVTDDAGLTDDDREFIFALSYDDAYTVNGIEETDLFDGILYAG